MKKIIGLLLGLLMLSTPTTRRASAQAIANGIGVGICTTGCTYDLTVLVPSPSASTHLVIDVTGYFQSGSFTAVPPCRLADTRIVGAALAPGAQRHFVVKGTNLSSQGGSAAGCGIPSGATAAMLNFVAINPVGAGYLKAWAYNTPEPGVSSIINYAPVRSCPTGTSGVLSLLAFAFKPRSDESGGRQTSMGTNGYLHGIYNGGAATLVHSLPVPNGARIDTMTLYAKDSHGSPGHPFDLPVGAWLVRCPLATDSACSLVAEILTVGAPGVTNPSVSPAHVLDFDNYVYLAHIDPGEDQERAIKALKFNWSCP